MLTRLKQEGHLLGQIGGRGGRYNLIIDYSNFFPGLCFPEHRFDEVTPLPRTTRRPIQTTGSNHDVFLALGTDEILPRQLGVFHRRRSGEGMASSEYGRTEIPSNT